MYPDDVLIVDLRVLFSQLYGIASLDARFELLSEICTPKQYVEHYLTSRSEIWDIMHSLLPPDSDYLGSGEELVAYVTELNSRVDNYIYSNYGVQLANYSLAYWIDHSSCLIRHITVSGNAIETVNKRMIRIFKEYNCDF
jgi:hypothetical protein